MSVAVVILATLISALQASEPQPGQAGPHPLDPLTAAEINSAAGLLGAAPWFPPDALFATIVLKEPAKRDVLAYTAGAPTSRQAFAVILDRKGNRTFKAVVNLTTSRVESFGQVRGVQPVVLEAEYDTLVRIVKADSRWQGAMRTRGIKELDAVQIDYWAVGQVAPQYQTRRLLRAVSYLKGESTKLLRPAD